MDENPSGPKATAVEVEGRPDDNIEQPQFLTDTLSSEFRKKHEAMENLYSRQAGAPTSVKTDITEKKAASGATTSLDTDATEKKAATGALTSVETAAPEKKVPKSQMQIDSAVASIPAMSSVPSKADTASAALPPPNLQRGGAGLQARRDPGAFRVSANSGNITPGDVFHSGMLLQPDAFLEPLQIHEDVPQYPKNGGLAVANEVMEEGAAAPEDLPRAEEFLFNEKGAQLAHSRKDFWTRIFVLGVVLIAGLTLVLGFTLTDKAPSPTVPPSTESPSQAPSFSPEEYVLSILSEESALAIRDNGSSQTKAFEWITNDPNLMTLSDDRILQRFALAILYFRNNGDSWANNTNWMSYEHHECQWYSKDVTKLDDPRWKNPLYERLANTSSFPCGDVSGDEDPNGEDVYTHLWFYQNGLTGSLPDELSLLTALKSLVLDVNSLTGTFPTSIGGLSSLEVLRLGNNEQYGSIPSEIGLLVNLQDLYIGNTKLSGQIPSEIGMLTAISLYAFSLSRVCLELMFWR